MVCKNKWAEEAKRMEAITQLAPSRVDGAARCAWPTCNRPLTKAGKCPKGHVQGAAQVTAARGQYAGELVEALQCLVRDQLTAGLVRGGGANHHLRLVARELSEPPTAEENIAAVGRLLMVCDEMAGDGYGQEQDPRVQVARAFFAQATAGIAADAAAQDPTLQELLAAVEAICQAETFPVGTITDAHIVNAETMAQLRQAVTTYRPTPYKMEGGRKVRERPTVEQAEQAVAAIARHQGLLRGTLLQYTLDVAENVTRAASAPADVVVDPPWVREKFAGSGTQGYFISDRTLADLQQALAFYRPATPTTPASGAAPAEIPNCPNCNGQMELSGLGPGRYQCNFCGFEGPAEPTPPFDMARAVRSMAELEAGDQAARRPVGRPAGQSSTAFWYPDLNPAPSAVASEVRQLLKQMTGITFQVRAGRGDFKGCVAVSPRGGGQFSPYEVDVLQRRVGWWVDEESTEPFHPLAHEGTGKLLVEVRARAAAERATDICTEEQLAIRVLPWHAHKGPPLWLFIEPDTGRDVWETKGILAEMGLRPFKQEGQEVVEIPADIAPGWVEHLPANIAAARGRFYAVHGRPYGQVYDNESDSWATIRERDGRLYGYPDSRHDGVPADPGNVQRLLERKK